VKGEQTELELSSVYEDAKQDREIRRLWRWVELSVWTDRMLATLEMGVKGTTLLSWGCSHFRQPESRYAGPHVGKPLTGEPDAGDPHVRFGGGRRRNTNRRFLPLSYRIRSRLKRC